MSNYIECKKILDFCNSVINRQGNEEEMNVVVESFKAFAEYVKALPPADVQPVPSTGIGDMSDGYHTFNQLYYQRMMLFATIVKQNKEKAWKSLRHEDGELCFGGGWFIVGIDTPEGSYTYHYECKDWDMFDCVELERGKHWDGHTEEDVTRLLSLPADVQPVTFCKNCQWLADIKDVETGELYHTCGVLAFDVPDGFACNQGKRKGADNEVN